jgi:hypothetical protein
MISNILVNNLLNQNKDKFLNMVRRAGVILKDSSHFSDDDIISTALDEAYPRIVLRIAGIKDKDGNPIFAGVGANIDYEEQEAAIIRLIVSPPYKSGILRIAASYTSATLLRFIPLNSDIKFMDYGNKLEEQATQDLDTIIGSIVANPDLLLSNLDQPNTIGKYKFYFALNLDLSTIPELLFDRVNGEVALSTKVDTLKYITIPQGYNAYIWYYLTSIQSTKFKEGLLPIISGSSLEQVINNLSIVINSCAIQLDTGLIASANKENIQEIVTVYSKAEVYETQLNKDKKLQFSIRPETYSIEIANRNPSNSVLKELITIRTLLLPSTLVEGKTDTEILKLRNLSSRLFDLKYGKSLNYKSLPWYGPQSIVVDIGAERKTSSNSNNVEKSNFFLDSFYFKGNLNSYNGAIKIRVSTDIQGLLDEWLVDLKGYNIEDSINLIFDSFYSRIDTTGVLLSAVKPYCLQVVPTRIFHNYNKIVIDLLDIPTGIQVGTGNPENLLTPYNPNYSSINLSIVKAKDCCDGTNNSGGAIGNGAYDVGKRVGVRRSPHLQNVLDKLERLNNCSWIIY